MLEVCQGRIGRALRSGWLGRNKTAFQASGKQQKPDQLRSLRTIFVKTCLLLLAHSASPTLSAAPQTAATPPHRLPTLTTAKQAHSLPAAEAVKSYPVHFKAVATYYDAFLDPRQTILFVHDGTAAMFISVPSDLHQPIPPRTPVEVTGVSAMGDFAPILAHPRLNILPGSAPLPHASPVSLTRLLSGQEDGQWVEVEGVVHAVFQDEHDINVQLAMQDGIISVTLPREPGRDYNALVDARVRIHANEAPIFNSERQMIAARLLCPGLSSIRVLEPGPADVFSLPTRPIKNLFQFTPAATLPRRVHVRGQVTLAWPGSLICIRDATRSLCARTLQTTSVRTGDVVDLAGFAELTDKIPSLNDAVFRKAPSGSTPHPSLVIPETVTSQEALSGNHDSELVEIQGQLIGRNMAAADTTLMLTSGGHIFSVVLPEKLADRISKRWADGSRLLVRGICSIQIDEQRTAREGGAAKAKLFRILLRSSADVVTLRKPSWWTPRHAVIVLTATLTISLLVLAWVVVLTRRLKDKTRLVCESEERYRHLAQHDLLTGLPTRQLLRDRLSAALENARRSGACLALLMLDLDKFKQINDAFGHRAGDEALKITARRALDIVRNTDTVARISGDEFVVLLAGLDNEHAAEPIARKLTEALALPLRLGGRNIPLSVSVGVCQSIGTDVDAEEILKRADLALYKAKADGRNRYQLFTAALADANETTLRYELALEGALAASEMEIHYQPMVCFKTRKLTGFEALVRWRSRELGMVLPEDFIPIAEQNGHIVPLGEWVLQEACRQMGQLEAQLGQTFVLAVNVSPRQIQRQPDLPQKISQILHAAGRSPSLLELEITEGILMNDSDSTHATLMELQRLGVRLAIDDFGIGFSSLSYITRFAIDRLKIDRSFIRCVLQENGALTVVRAMIAMAHGLCIQVVAEGVETEEEFVFLRDEGCDTAQGYYLSRPVPGDQLAALFDQLQQFSCTSI